MEFTHFDDRGNARMVDVSGKEITARTAIAEGTIQVSPEVFQAIEQKTVKKGDVLTVAQVAGILGCKRTSELIPMCHLLNLTNATLTFELLPESCEVRALCTVKTEGKTGVEMEALTGVSVALLTVYDMCKAIDKRMVMKEIHLVEKHGGKSGDSFRRTGDETDLETALREAEKGGQAEKGEKEPWTGAAGQAGRGRAGGAFPEMERRPLETE